MTWYAARAKWHLSPGYDLPTTPVWSGRSTRCASAAMSGGLETVPENPQWIAITEKTIRCENCHGPGSLHRDHQWRGNTRGRRRSDDSEPAEAAAGDAGVALRRVPT